MRAARVGLLAAIAVAVGSGGAYPGIPAAMAGEAAGKACSAWTAQEEEDEGGPVFTASICSSDDPTAYLSLTCFADRYELRVDLIGPSDEAPLGEAATVRFGVDGADEALEMTYEDLDGRHAAELPMNAPVIARLAGGHLLTVSADGYPSRRYPLAGSGAALKALAAHCS